MRIFIRIILLCTIQCLVFLNQNHAQCLILGADLSYVNKIEENGGIYRDKNGVQVDPFTLFSEEGANMIRLRLWHTPENNIDHCGNPISTNNLEDMLIAAARVSENKMDIMLAIHYGDYFNDPGKQQMPKAWKGLEHATLLDSIYNYTFSVIEKMIDQGSAPSIVGVGNETTWGFIDETASTNGWKWPEDAEKFNIAFEAIDEINNIYNLSIKKAIHFTVNTSEWLSGLFLQNGISNFDIIGISFYPGFSTDISLNELGNIIEQLNNQYTKDIMIFETGFVWAINGWADSYNNILNSNGSVIPYPASPEGQRDYLFGLAELVEEAGGSGIFYWEPTYISSNMCTKWGKGSPWENVSFFDFNNENAALPAFDFFEYCNTSKVNENDLSELRIYPNPGYNKNLTVKCDSGILSWKLYDLNNRLIDFEDFPQASYQIKITTNQKGLFLLVIQTKQNKKIYKKLMLF